LKKTLILSLLAVTLIGFGIKGQAYALLNIGDLGSFGNVIVSPGSTTIDIGTTMGKVDYAVLYNSSNLRYSYFYQIENIGVNGLGVTGHSLGKFTFTSSFSSVGSGIMGDGLDVVNLLTNSPGEYEAYLDSPFLGGNELALGQTSNRFYFQFNEKPGMITGNLIDGSVGSGSIPGPVPEPSSMMLLGMGVLGLLGFRKKS